MISLRKCGSYIQWSITQYCICSMKGPRDKHTSEVSQTKTNIIWYYLCGISKIIQMNLYAKQKQTHRHRKQTYDYHRGNIGNVVY